MIVVKLGELKRLLSSAGYSKIRNGKHEMWSNGTIKIAVPSHDLKPAISHKIIKTCGLMA